MEDAITKDNNWQKLHFSTFQNYVCITHAAEIEDICTSYLHFFVFNNHIPIKAIITYNCYQICSEEAIIIAVRHGHEICSEGTVIITVRSVLQGMLGSEKKVNKL